MRKHRYALGATFASLAIVLLAACQGNTGGSGSQSGGATSNLKIGLVTDVGTLDDHNFNQYSWEGAKAGAQAVGAAAPQSVVTTQSADCVWQPRTICSRRSRGNERPSRLRASMIPSL